MPTDSCALHKMLLVVSIFKSFYPRAVPLLASPNIAEINVTCSTPVLKQNRVLKSGTKKVMTFLITLRGWAS